MRILVICLALSLISGPSFATKWTKQGASWGGAVSTDFSILAVRAQSNAKKTTGRLLFEMGLGTGHPTCCEIPFYHLEVDNEKQRAVLTVTRTYRSKWGSSEIVRLIERSRFVEMATVEVEPTERSMVITVYLKEKMSMRVKKVISKDRRAFLALDMRKIK